MHSSHQEAYHYTEFVVFHKFSHKLYSFFSRLFYGAITEDVYDAACFILPLLPSLTPTATLAPDAASEAAFAKDNLLEQLNNAWAEIEQLSAASVAGGTTPAEHSFGTGVFAHDFPVDKQLEFVDACFKALFADAGIALTQSDYVPESEGFDYAKVYEGESLHLYIDEALAPDHLAVLLDFMAAFSQKLSCFANDTDWRKPLEKKKYLFRVFLGPWLDEVLRKAAAIQANNIYTLLLKYLIAFIAFDSAETDAMLVGCAES